MNRIFSIVWNRARRAWMVAGEHASGCAKDSGGRPGRTFAAALLAGLLVSAPAIGQSLPTGGEVVAGHGSIGTPHAGSLAIEQSSQRMAIDWQQFNIGAGNTVRFNQPGTDAVALNRVLGADASQIMGQLQANGRVFLVNPNGVLFGQGAEVDVGGLVASTLGIGNADFMAGNYRFQGGPSANGRPASVVNQGRITAAEGGAVALLGGQVHNQGVVQARLGTVAMAAGNAVTLDFAGDGLLRVQIDQAAKDALVDNGQLVQADGGQVLMTASASDALLQTVVNNTGVIEARTLANRAGKIVLLGDFAGGTVKVDGRLDASAPDGGDGGFIDTSGAYVRVADGVKITTLAPQGKTGTWLIDPTDFTIEAGDADRTDSGIGADTLSDQLATSDVVIQTLSTGDQNGDIHVEAPVEWTGPGVLTLQAHRDINVNANITSNGVWSKDTILTLISDRDIKINADIAVNGDGAGLLFTAGMGDGQGRVEVNSSISITGLNGVVALNADGEVSVGADITVNGDSGKIILAGSNLSIDSNVSVEGDGGSIDLSACGATECGGHIAVNGDVSIDGNNGSINMIGEASVTISGNVSIAGDQGAINMFGGTIATNELSSVSIVGEMGSIAMLAAGDISIGSNVSVDGSEAQVALLGSNVTIGSSGSLSVKNGLIALDACGEPACGFSATDDFSTAAGDVVLAAQGWSEATGGDVKVEGDVSVFEGGAIAMTGEFIFIDSKVSVEGDGGVIALAACTDDGCGNISVSDDIFVIGDDGVISLMAAEGIYTTGDISIVGSNGNIELSAGELIIDGAVSIAGDDGHVMLEACGSCDPALGNIELNGDVSVVGDNGQISATASGTLTLDAVISATDGGSSNVALVAGGNIAGTQNAVIETDQLNVISMDGEIDLGRGAHRVGLLYATARNDVKFTNNQALVLGGADVMGDGNIIIRTTAGDLALLSAATPVVQIAGSGDIDLISAGGFHNLAGAGALQAANGSWRIWSQNPAHSALGGLGYEFKQYNAHYGSSAVLGQGNGVLYAFAPVLDVGLTGSTAKTYDGTDLAALDDTNYVLKGGVYGDDQVVFSKPTDGRYSDQNAGAGKTVTAHGLQVLQAYEAGGAQVYGYQINTSVSADIGRIDKRPITVAASDQSKFLGQADPALTWRIAAGELVSGDGFIGALARDAGEALGAYAIRQGSLSAGANYVLDFIDGKLVVLPATADDVLGERAPAYQAAIVSAQNLQQGPMAFDQSAQGDGAVGSALGGSQPSTLYHIENSGLRMPEGI